MHYTIPMRQEDETLDFWTSVMGFDVTASIDIPDGRRAITIEDGTNSSVYIFSVDFENSRHSLLDERQTPHYWLNPEEHDWLEEEIDSEARKWIIGFHHMAWGVDSVEELKIAQDKLNEHGIPNQIFNRHNVAISLYFPEPVNGLNLEVHAPGQVEKRGELSDMKYPSGSEETKTTEELDDGHEVKSEGIIRRGSDDGMARILSKT